MTIFPRILRFLGHRTPESALGGISIACVGASLTTISIQNSLKDGRFCLKMQSANTPLVNRTGVGSLHYVSLGASLRLTPDCPLLSCSQKNASAFSFFGLLFLRTLSPSAQAAQKTGVGSRVCDPTPALDPKSGSSSRPANSSQTLLLPGGDPPMADQNQPQGECYFSDLLECLSQKARLLKSQLPLGACLERGHSRW